MGNVKPTYGLDEEVLMGRGYA